MSAFGRTPAYRVKRHFRPARLILALFLIGFLFQNCSGFDSTTVNQVTSSSESDPPNETPPNSVLPSVQQFADDRLLSHDAPLGMMPSSFGQKYRPNIFSNTRVNNKSGGIDGDQSFRRMDCSWFVWWFTAFLAEGKSPKPNSRILVEGGTMWALENGTGGGVNGRWVKIFEMTSFHSIGSGKVSPGSIYRDDYHSGLAGYIAPYVGDADDWRYETGGSGKTPSGGDLNLQGTKSVRTLQQGYNFHGYFEPGGRKYVDRTRYKGYAFYARVKAVPHDSKKPLDNDGQTYVVGLGVDIWDASNTYIGLNGALDGHHNGDMGTYRHTYVKNDWTWISAVSIPAEDWLANPIPGLPK